MTVWNKVTQKCWVWWHISTIINNHNTPWNLILQIQTMLFGLVSFLWHQLLRMFEICLQFFRVPGVQRRCLCAMNSYFKSDLLRPESWLSWTEFSSGWVHFATVFGITISFGAHFAFSFGTHISFCIGFRIIITFGICMCTCINFLVRLALVQLPVPNKAILSYMKVGCIGTGTVFDLEGCFVLLRVAQSYSAFFKNFKFAQSW